MLSPVKPHKSRWPAVLALLLALIAVIRIVSSYSQTSQAFDEPCHVAAAIELLARHTYKLDPVHPPLARLAIGLPLFLAGERFPHLDPLDNSLTYNDYGNAILYDSGHYQRNLTLARLGVLPFFLLATAIVFLWARREFGDLAGVMAAALFTTLPNVLAFSSIAYIQTWPRDQPSSCCFSPSSTGSTMRPDVPRYGWAWPRDSRWPRRQPR